MNGHAQPLVTVIVPVYNAEAYLDVCLCSLRDQKYRNVEVLLVDDGSTDASGDICRRFAAADTRFRVICQENRGVSAARNAALTQARGAYIRFVDSDDAVPADGISALVEAMETGCELAVCNYYECREGVKTLRDYGQGRLSLRRYALAMAKKPIHHFYSVLWNKLFTLRIIEENHLRFDEDSCYGEDFAFILRYLPFVQTVGTVQTPGYLYDRGREGSLSRRVARDEETIARAAYVYRQYRGFWQGMGWYAGRKKLVQFTGARLYYEALKDIRPEQRKRLYDACLRDNGFSDADMLFFRALHALWRAKQRLRAAR